MSISELISSVNAAADSPLELGEEERSSLFAACHKLKCKVESPRDATMRFLFSPHQAVALSLAVDIKLFDAAAKLSEKTEEIQLDDLVSEVGVDRLLVVRVMRFMVGMDIFKELGQGRFAATPLSNTYVTSSPFAQIIIHMSCHNEVISTLPSFLAENGFNCPGDAYNGPFQAAKKTDLHAFDWLATQPRLQHAFNVAMTTIRLRGTQPWYEYFPASSKLTVASPTETLLVDIGGGVGHDLIAFKNHHPELPGNLVLQEIPVVVDSITDLPSGIQAMKHSFFSPQPIKHAKAYYLANVLHDWPDKQAREILCHIRDAMDSESRLLINENIVPESGVSLYSATADLILMADFSALERTEAQFCTLLEEVGLELVKSWAPEGAGEEGEGRRLLEVVLKQT